MVSVVFSLPLLDPQGSPRDFLGNSGLGLAGDAFDARIVRNLVSPHLGAGTFCRSLDKVLPAVPNWVYVKLERWHHLSFLRTRPVLNMLHSTKAAAFAPEKIEALIRLIEEDLPIRRISEHARREKSIRHGHISTLHIWWARRPLAAPARG